MKNVGFCWSQKPNKTLHLKMGIERVTTLEHKRVSCGISLSKHGYTCDTIKKRYQLLMCFYGHIGQSIKRTK